MPANEPLPPADEGRLDLRVVPLVERLISASHGWEEWRVADPVSGSYCIVFSRHGEGRVLDPEHEAREWLRKHRTEFPGGRFVGYEVQRHEVRNYDRALMHEAATELLRLRDALERITQCSTSRKPVMLARAALGHN